MICLGDDKKQRDNHAEVIKIAAKIKADSKAQALDPTDMETFNWLWHKYTQKPMIQLLRG